MAAIGFGIFYFIFLKIYCAIAFDEQLSVVASAISAVVISFLEGVVALKFRGALGEAITNRETGQPHNSSLKTIWITYVGMLPAMTLAVILIARGFSSGFYDDVIEGSYRSFLGLDWENIFVLGFGILLMTLPAMVMVHQGLKATQRGEF